MVKGPHKFRNMSVFHVAPIWQADDRLLQAVRDLDRLSPPSLGVGHLGILSRGILVSRNAECQVFPCLEVGIMFIKFGTLRGCTATHQKHYYNQQ
jgi:hypothetical protein